MDPDLVSVLTRLMTLAGTIGAGVIIVWGMSRGLPTWLVLVIAGLLVAAVTVAWWRIERKYVWPYLAESRRPKKKRKPTDAAGSTTKSHSPMVRFVMASLAVLAALGLLVVFTMADTTRTFALMGLGILALLIGGTAIAFTAGRS